MTAKKDLKRRVRERQERTGESYTTARAQVIAQAEPPPPAKQPPFSVVELVDATDDAAKLGMKCTVLVSPSLASQIAPARVLERIRDALIATGEDPQTRHFRDVMLRGERAPVRGSREDWAARWEVTRQFLTRVKAGIGGVHPSGDIMALQVDDQLVLVQLGHVPHMPPIPRPQLRVFLTTVDASLADSPLPLRR
jgi:hypothetical protein